MKILLADKQDITRAGLSYVIQQLGKDVETKFTEDKAELMLALREDEDSLVILDYTLFDINDADELLILNQRFPETRWLLFSEDLSADFVRVLIASSMQFSILLKESPMMEIKEAIRYCMSGNRFICQRMTEVLLAPSHDKEEKVNLTKTETEILKDIALGMTTKEIAEKRFSSFHTVNTHRKNIFRKLGVNNVHEATKYALRAGLVDSAEYYI
ncbi:MAG TPA: DNA-binding response regulator [Prevotella sp.]|nr:response regulator transcription factor [uncultured Prevotella sp.]HBF05106.1 DNA-binding response regulator [Candidatus Segatella violae]